MFQQAITKIYPLNLSAIEDSVMNTEISLPESVFKEAGTVAQQLGISRNELYAEAIKSYLQQHRHQPLSEQSSEDYVQEASDLDLAIASLHLMSLPREIW